eukprot:TRINITY_DN1087_c0_g3_i1.p1 TRINITY_DN1087_c0_g3~~TRINITY_DN1087_c0_g3_i1.p1  ORF type:complete len:157 (+),score=29.68 TRINITY_DN1087_c0_g3_i1:148-618(+)
MALRRIDKELTDYEKSSSPFVIHRVGSHSLRCIIFGERDTPYFGGVFWVSVQMPIDYPFKHPTLMFETKIFHPNITPDGVIDIDLQCMWSPACTIEKVLETVKFLLREPDSYSMNAAAHLRIKSEQEYKNTATNHTREHACPETSLTKGRIPRMKR